MNLLADENIHLLIIERLRADGHLVVCMADMAPGDPDTSVLAIAEQHNAVILTEDKDFGDLVIRDQMPVALGVILVRLDGFPPSERATMIARVIQERESELLGTFTVIKPRAVRIRSSFHKQKNA